MRLLNKTDETLTLSSIFLALDIYFRLYHFPAKSIKILLDRRQKLKMINQELYVRQSILIFKLFLIWEFSIYNINLSNLTQTKMDAINIDIISQLLEHESDCQKLSNCLRDINQSCNLDFKYLKPQVIISTAKKINFREQMARNSENKVSNNQSNEQCISWSFGEFKIFIWTIIYQCATHNIILRDIDQKIILEIQSIFASKAPNFIRYELRFLMSFKLPQPTVWCKQETRILQKIMGELSDNDSNEEDTDHVNWRWVSFKFFTESKCRYFRNLNHCREKWNNHLNPNVKKSNWTKEEDIRLFELVERFGHKWSKISKFMDHTRTEHMVKNRYNRFLRLWNISKKTSFSVVRSLIRAKIVNNQIQQKPKKVATKKDKKTQEVVKVQQNISQQVVENKVYDQAISFEQSQQSQVIKRQEQQDQYQSIEQKKPEMERILYYPFYSTFAHPFIPIPTFPYLR